MLHREVTRRCFGEHAALESRDPTHRRTGKRQVRSPTFLPFLHCRACPSSSLF